MKRGEVWWAELPDPWRRRPVLLLARDEAYRLLTWVIVVPTTTNVRSIPTAVELTETDGMPQKSAVAVDNLLAVRKTWLTEPITTLTPERMLEVEHAIHFAMNLSF